MAESNHLTVAEAVARLSCGKLTSLRLAEDCLARVSAREPSLEAWAYINPDQVLEQARACDMAPRRSALHGVPVGLKDIIDTADMPTEYGSPIYAGNRPRSDAACVAMLRQAGAVIMGKTASVEFAMGQPGRTRNPHNLEHTPGGTSSGSAAAVADFMVPLALGTQTSGSTIRPAAYCGVVGYKPSFNVINRAGIKPNSESLDTLGLMGRCVEDVKILFSVLTDRADIEAWNISPRIGYCRTANWQHAAPYAMAALDDAAAALARAGARITELGSPQAFEAEARPGARGAIMEYESSRALSHERRCFPGKISPVLTAKLKKADACTLAEYVAAQRRAVDRRAALNQAFSQYDILLVPSAAGEAPRGIENTGDAMFSRMWTELHVPAITLPFRSGPLGLPLGIQLIGAFGCDSKLLSCAAWVQQALA